MYDTANQQRDDHHLKQPQKEFTWHTFNDKYHPELHSNLHGNNYLLNYIMFCLKSKQWFVLLEKSCGFDSKQDKPAIVVTLP